MHCTPSWLQGCDRHYVSHNAPVESERPCSCSSDQYRKLSRDERHFILLKTSHHTSNGMVPPEFVVLFTKLSLKIGIEEADKCTLVSNESAVNEFENLQ